MTFHGSMTNLSLLGSEDPLHTDPAALREETPLLPTAPAKKGSGIIFNEVLYGVINAIVGAPTMISFAAIIFQVGIPLHGCRQRLHSPVIVQKSSHRHAFGYQGSPLCALLVMPTAFAACLAIQKMLVIQGLGLDVFA